MFCLNVLASVLVTYISEVHYPHVLAHFRFAVAIIPALFADVHGFLKFLTYLYLSIEVS